MEIYVNLVNVNINIRAEVKAETEIFPSLFCVKDTLRKGICTYTFLGDDVYTFLKDVLNGKFDGFLSDPKETKKFLRFYMNFILIGR